MGREDRPIRVGRVPTAVTYWQQVTVHNFASRTSLTRHAEYGDLINIEALATRLGVTQRFVRRLVAERRIPFLKIGRFIRFDPVAVDRWLDECRR